MQFNNFNFLVCICWYYIHLEKTRFPAVARSVCHICYNVIFTTERDKNRIVVFVVGRRIGWRRERRRKRPVDGGVVIKRIVAG